MKTNTEAKSKSVSQLAEIRAIRVTSLPVAQLNILRHAIGYDDAGNDRWHGASAEDRRNHFVMGPNCTDFSDCVQLTAFGLMHDHGPQQLASGNHCFTVTDSGRALVLANRPAPKKLTRSQARYRRYRECSDCFEGFLAFLRHDVHLFCAQWGCVKGDKPDMARLRRDYQDRMEQLDREPAQAVAA